MGSRWINASIWLAVIGVLGVEGAARGETGIAVTSCGSTVTGVGELVGDLDCSAYAANAVTVHGTFKLNGHTLTGAADTSLDPITVACGNHGSCTILGPGTIAGGAFGISGRSVKMKDVTVSGAGTGIDAARARLRSCTITGNGQVVSANDGPGTLGGGGVAIGYRLSMTDSHVTGNGFYGVLHHGELQSALDIKRSVITGNGNVAAYCADHIVSCGDIVTRFDLRRVKTRATTCGTSRVGNDGTALGLCSGD